jgi:hypothetical protein
MTKKEYLLRLLNHLKSQRPLAQGLLVLVENNVVDDSVLNALVDVFQKLLNQESDEQQKNLLTHSIGFLEKIKRLEKDQKSDDANDLENIE